MLTLREQEVLDARERGFTNKEVASRLAISVHTVRTHVRRVLRKLDCGNVAEATFKLREQACGNPRAREKPPAGLSVSA